MRGGRMAAEAEAVVEPHHVEACAVRSSALRPQLSSQSRKLVSLMVQPATNLKRGFAHELLRCHVRMSRETQGRTVRTTARNHPQEVCTGAHSQSKDETARACDPM